MASVIFSYLNPFGYSWSNPFFSSGYGGRAPSVALVNEKKIQSQFPVLTDEILANARKTLKPIRLIDPYDIPQAPEFPSSLLCTLPAENVFDEIKRYEDIIKPSFFKR